MNCCDTKLFGQSALRRITSEFYAANFCSKTNFSFVTQNLKMLIKKAQTVLKIFAVNAYECTNRSLDKG